MKSIYELKLEAENLKAELDEELREPHERYTSQMKALNEQIKVLEGIQDLENKLKQSNKRNRESYSKQLESKKRSLTQIKNISQFDFDDIEMVSRQRQDLQALIQVKEKTIKDNHNLIEQNLKSQIAAVTQKEAEIAAYVEKLAKSAESHLDPKMKKILPELYRSLHLGISALTRGEEKNISVPSAVTHFITHPIQSWRSLLLIPVIKEAVDEELSLKPKQQYYLNAALNTKVIKKIASEPGLIDFIAQESFLIEQAVSKALYTEKLQNGLKKIDIISDKEKDLIKAFTPIALAAVDEYKEEVKNLLPRLLDLLGAEKVSMSQIQEILTILQPILSDNRANIVPRLSNFFKEHANTIASFPIIKASLEKNNINAGLVESTLPLIANILENHTLELEAIVNKLPQLMSKDPEISLSDKLTPVVPAINQILFDKNSGIAKSLPKIINNNKDSIVAAIKPNVEKLGVNEQLIQAGLPLIANILENNAAEVEGILSQLPTLMSGGDPNISLTDKINSVMPLASKILFDQDKKVAKTLLAIIKDNQDSIAQIIAQYVSNKKVSDDLIKPGLQLVADTLEKNSQGIESILNEVLKIISKQKTPLEKGRTIISMLGNQSVKDIINDTTNHRNFSDIMNQSYDLLPPKLAQNVMEKLHLNDDAIKQIIKDLTPIIPDLANEILNPKNLTNIQNSLENFYNPQINNPKDKVFSVLNPIVAIMRSDDFKEVYKKEIIPIINNNAKELSNALEGFTNSDPQLSKFKISGEKVLNVIKSPDAVDRLCDAYDAFQEKRYLKFTHKVTTAVLKSEEIRDLVFDAIINRIKSFVMDLLPESLKREKGKWETQVEEQRDLAATSQKLENRPSLGG